MAAYIAIFLSSLSIILLIIVLVKFAKLFSTDSIIEKTKKQMNKIILDINKNANMDIDLINEATRRTRTLIKDADDKMEEFREASKLLRDMIATIETQNFQATNKIPIYKNSLIDEIKPIGQMKSYKEDSNSFEKEASGGTGTAPVGKSNSIKAKAYERGQQQSLFDDDNNKNKEKSQTKIGNFVADDESMSKIGSGGVIPNIVTNIIPPSNFTPKKKLDDKVKELISLGLDAEAISAELSCPISEVQFIIDMLNS